jgi:DNA-binding MarR family transcriptional regulator
MRSAGAAFFFFKKVLLVGHETSKGWIKGRSVPGSVANKLEPAGHETGAPGRSILRTADQSITAREIRQLLKARRARAAFFGADLFADPAWDILLFTYAARLEQQRVSIGAVCESAAVPSTTALRWINKLEQDGWVSRSDDPLDGRRAWIELSADGLERMERYLESVLRSALLV